MPSVQTIRKQFVQAFERSVLPSFQPHQSPSVVLAELPVHTPNGVEVIHVPIPLLENKPIGTQQHWPDARVNSSATATMILVIEGRVDLRIGTTVRIAESAPRDDEWTRNGCHVLRLGAPSCLLILPDTPYADGSTLHWEDDTSPPPESKLLWIREVPRGVLCHICSTQHGKHKSEHSLLVEDEDALAILSLFTKELRRREKESQVIAHHYLTTLLLCVQRRLIRDSPVLANTVHLPPPEPALTDRPTSADRIIKLADEFVYHHLREPITLPDIARHCGVSPTHLNRVFNTKLGLSAKRFIYRQRIRSAQRILAESDLPVKEVADLVGFSRASHFCRVFQRIAGTSPTEFRAIHRT